MRHIFCWDEISGEIDHSMKNTRHTDEVVKWDKAVSPSDWAVVEEEVRPTGALIKYKDDRGHVAITVISASYRVGRARIRREIEKES